MTPDEEAAAKGRVVNDYGETKTRMTLLLGEARSLIANLQGLADQIGSFQTATNLDLTFMNPEKVQRLLDALRETARRKADLESKSRCSYQAGEDHSTTGAEMSNMHYVSVRRRSREAILAALSGKNADEIGDALLSAAYWEDDWEWAQEQLFKFSEFDSDKVLWAVATGIGFIAAFHGEVDERAAEAIINRLMTRRAEAAAAEETLADIDQFVRRRKGGRDIDLAERLPEDWQPPSGHLNQNPGDEPS